MELFCDFFFFLFFFLGGEEVLSHVLHFTLFFYSFIYEIKQLDFYTLHEVISLIILAPLWHYTQPLQ